MKTEEDEAFEELERKLKQQPKELDDDTLCYRNEVLEEVAAHLEHKFTAPFGADTIASFAAYIRSMKR